MGSERAVVKVGQAWRPNGADCIRHTNVPMKVTRIDDRRATLQEVDEPESVDWAMGLNSDGTPEDGRWSLVAGAPAPRSPVLWVGMRLHRVDDRTPVCDRGILWTVDTIWPKDHRASLVAGERTRVTVELDADRRITHGQWVEAPAPSDTFHETRVDITGPSLVRTPEEYVDRFGGTLGEARGLFAEAERRAMPLRVIRPEPVGRAPGRIENVCNITVDLNSVLSATDVLDGIRKAFGSHVADHAEVSVTDTEADARRQVLIEAATPPAGVSHDAWLRTLSGLLEDRDPEDGSAWCSDAEDVERDAALLRAAYPKLRGGR